MERVTELLGQLSSRLELYRTGTHHNNPSLHNNEFVGRVPDPLKELQPFLRAEFEQLSDRSWRRVDGETQLHIFVYGINGNTFIYAHHEPRFDTNPIDHLFANTNGGSGVKEMKKLLDEHGIVHKPLRP